MLVYSLIPYASIESDLSGLASSVMSFDLGEYLNSVTNIRNLVTGQ